MDLHELKQKTVRDTLKIEDSFGRILAFIDFGNVNYWFEGDRQAHGNVALKDNEKLAVDISKLKEFLSIFSNDTRFYYGHDPINQKSIGFIQWAEEVFSKNRVFSKPLQKIRNYLETTEEKVSNTRVLQHDVQGDFVYIPKCNFDVEISVDAIKTIEHYDTICLLSSDADFAYLLRFIKRKGKKVILIKGGHVVHQLREVADLVISAQDIKDYITAIKQKPGVKPGLADRNPESTGRTTKRP